MRTISKAVAVVLLGVVVGGCERSTPPATGPAPTPTASDRVKEDLKAAGHNLKDAGGAVVDEAKPAVQKAKEEGRDLIHKGAQKVADMTATQPAPASQP